MARLSVNINKIASLRNTRGNNTPCLITAAKNILSYGAKSLTVHPRPDERHIKKQDAYDLAELLSSPEYKHIEYNIEGYPSADFLELVLEIKPTQYTLVPDPPEALTSNAGWKLPSTTETLKPILEKLKTAHIRSSLFVDPKDVNEEYLQQLSILKPDRIELYTEQYAKDFNTENRLSTLDSYKTAAQKVLSLGIDINAGHDLDIHNLDLFLKTIPECLEVSIGHALICESLYSGLENCTKAYLGVACD